MNTEQLDYVLVPLGYHAWLLLRVRRRPSTTVIGVNAINRRIWVRHVMEEPSGKHAVLAVQTIRNNIMASTLLASTAITLSSLIAVLMSSGGGGEGSASAASNDNSGGLLPGAPLVVGATGAPALSAKFFAILVCFLLAFLLNVQSIRYFWSLGARVFYFSCPVFLWLFGPIPMLVACVAMVCALYFLDVCKDWEEEGEGGDDDDDDHQCTSDERSSTGQQGKDGEQQV
ncbi:uncharacterized protein C2845_PM14G02860 [Panicum miliaceum]|uniref:Uncharacterized protein n=1 Tax=Panicum miliaceum TaxID=4540 RepID=A0A3L6PKM9_PANMI|nr:uncharacterized protein C2845_PM14G02860 [Panicum miliaceum]